MGFLANALRGHHLPGTLHLCTFLQPFLESVFDREVFRPDYFVLVAHPAPAVIRCANQAGGFVKVHAEVIRSASLSASAVSGLTSGAGERF